VIPIDSIFSPVRRVAYAVEQARVGQRTDFDKLTLDIGDRRIGRSAGRAARGGRAVDLQLAIFTDEDRIEELRAGRPGSSTAGSPAPRA